MTSDLPEYFFRVRENGAMVFRIDTENRHLRLDMNQIAVVNIKNGDIKPQNGVTLSPSAISTTSCARSIT